MVTGHQLRAGTEGRRHRTAPEPALVGGEGAAHGGV